MDIITCRGNGAGMYREYLELPHASDRGGSEWVGSGVTDCFFHDELLVADESVH